MRTLIRGAIRAAGQHHELWNGRDDGGLRVPAGGYFVRLRTPGGQDTGRIVVWQ